MENNQCHVMKYNQYPRNGKQSIFAQSKRINQCTRNGK